MAGYQTGAPELRQAAQELNDANVALMAELKSFITAVDAVEGSWKGQAHTAFQNLTQKFAQDSKTLNDKLVEISEAVSGSATLYDQQEQQANESITAITATLDG